MTRRTRRNGISNAFRQARVTVEYDCRGNRETKTFDSAFKARSFYAAKFKLGRNPKIVATL